MHERIMIQHIKLINAQLNKLINAQHNKLIFVRLHKRTKAHLWLPLQKNWHSL